MENYPFSRHANPTRWTLPTESGVVFAQGNHECTAFLMVNDIGDTQSCVMCQRLASDSALQKLVQNALNDELHTTAIKNEYLTRRQLILRLDMHKARANKLRLFVFKQGEKLAKLNRVAADNKKMITLLSKNDVPRLRCLLARMVDRNASATIINRQIQLAIDGRYMPRMHVACDDHDRALDDAELALILGGPRMLWALQRRHGALSRTHVLKHRPRARFVTSWNESVNATTVRTNLQRFMLARSAPDHRVIHHVMVDDVAIESRRRVSPEDGRIRGYGRENNFSGLALEIVSAETLEALKEAEERTENPLTLGEELTVFAIGANRETEYAISLVAGSATCKKGALAADLRPALATIIDEWKDSGAWEKRGPISTIAKDGASVMNQAAFVYVTQHEIDRASAVGVALFGDDGGGCMLFFCKCGHHPGWPIVDVCDDKHFVKRFRTALKRAEGIQVGVTTFNIRLISRLLTEPPLNRDAQHVKTWFGDGEEDAQNVPACMKLLQAISQFRLAPADSFSSDRRNAPGFNEFLGSLRFLGHLAACEFIFVSMQSPDDGRGFMSLSELNRNASKLAHIEFVLFRKSAGAFVPPQHYYNTQITVRGKYVSQAVSKAIGSSHYWWYQDSDDRLENMFGMMRTLEHGTNFDMVQFEERASALMALEEIYSRSPELRKPSRRLSGQLFDRLNPKTIVAKGTSKDYSAACLDNVHLATCWALGAKDAAELLISLGVADPAECDWSIISHETPTTDMVRPRGEWVGITVEYEAPRPSEPPPAPAPPTDEDLVDSWLNFEDLEEEGLDAIEETDESVNTFVVAGDSVSGRRCQRRLRNFLGFDSITVDKAVRLYWSTNPRKSGERIRRVRGALRAGTSLGDGEEAEGEPEIVAHIDPLLAIVHGSSGVTSVIVMPISFDTATTTKVDSMLLSDLPNEKSVVECKVLKPSSATGGDSGMLIFKDANFGETLKVPGLLLFPVDPTKKEVHGDNDGGGGSSGSGDGGELARTEWHLPTYLLNVLLELHWDTVTTASPRFKERPAQELPRIRKESLYCDAEGHPLLIVDGTETGNPDAVVQPTTTGIGEVHCEICNQRWPIEQMRLHMGAHLLELSWEHHPRRHARPTFPCGICGIRSAIPQELMDPRSQLGCGVSVKKSGSTLKPVHQCQLLQGATCEYSLKSASKFALSSPCTNRPVQCPKCSFVVWSYSMTDHFADKHSGTSMPPALAQEVALRYHERDGTVQLLSKYPKSVKVKCEGVKCVCKNTPFV